MNRRANGGSLLETAGSGGVPVAHKNDLIGKIMISAIAVLFVIVLLILILHFYVRWHVLRRAARRARRLRRLIFARDGQAPPVSHAVDPAVLKSLPVLLFSADGSDADELKECSVCLNEFKDGEKIRRLPRCAHSFHIDCIDMWFSSHSSCPLCRAAVEAISTAADSPSPTDLCSSCQREELISSSSSDSTAGEVVIDIPAGLIEGLSGEAEEVGLGRRQTLMWSSSRVLCLIWRSLTLDIWRKRVDGLVTDPELDGREAVPPPAISPPAPTE